MKLTKNEIKFLSQSFTANTPISVFANIDGELDGTEYQALVDKKVIAGNSYSDEALQILTILANPQSGARFLGQTPNYIVEKYTYRMGDKLVLSENDEGTLNFSIIDDVTTLSANFSEIFGLSAIATTSIEEVFTPGEMTVILAMADIIRRNKIAEYADVKIEEKGISIEDIQSETKGVYKNGLTGMYLKNYRFDPPSSDSVNKGVQSLVERGLINEGANYTLSEDFINFAKNFLIIDTIAFYETFSILPSGEISTLARLATSAGKNDILAIMYDGDDVQMNTISAIQLLYNIEAVMSCPEFEKPQEDEPIQEEPPAVDPNTWTCACGRVNTGNFCASCGSKKP